VKDSLKKLKANLSDFSSSYSAKALILIGLFLLLVALIFTGRRSYKVVLHEGDISLKDIYAPYDFTYPGEIDEAKTKALRDKALKGFLPIFDIELGYWDKKRKILSEFPRELADVKRLKDIDDNLRVEKLKGKINLEIEGNLLLPFLQEDVRFLEEKLLSVLDKLSSKIITDAATIDRLIESNKEEIIVRDRHLNVEAKIARSDLYTKDELKPVIEKELAAEGVGGEELSKAFTNLLQALLTPNLIYNQEETEARRKALLEGIPPVYNQILVKKNE